MKFLIKAFLYPSYNIVVGKFSWCPSNTFINYFYYAFQHQSQVLTAVERAKQVTMTELNAIIGVSKTFFIILCWFIDFTILQKYFDGVVIGQYSTNKPDGKGGKGGPDYQGARQVPKNCIKKFSFSLPVNFFSVFKI